MLLTIASAFFYTEVKSGFVKMFSGIMAVMLIKWEIQGMVLLSLLLQFFLVGFGHRLQYHGKASVCVCFHVWWTYLAADWIATVALSTLLKAEKNELNSQLVVFWTPFLLLHLGGPHTISAYSLSDNELWMRYCLGILIQGGVAVYVCVKFQTHSTLTYVAIPLFITGIIKYGGRIWILRAASSKQFSKCIFSASSPTQAATTDSGTGAAQTDSGTVKLEALDDYLERKGIIQEGRYIHKAFCLYKIFIPLFSDIKLWIKDNLTKIVLLSADIPTEDAFKLVEMELGFLYDVLYTKTTILNSRWGVILHSIGFFFTFSALIAFSIIVDKNSYPNVDVVITYLLLGGAIVLDVYSAVSHVFSKWAKRVLTIPDNKVPMFVRSGIVSQLGRGRAKKGMTSMAQLSLIDYFFKVQTSWWARAKIVRALDTEDSLAKFWGTTWEPVNLHLKNFIYSSLRKMYEKYERGGFQYGELLELLKSRGRNVFQSNWEEFQRTIKDVAFSHTLLVWHVATFIIFHEDHRRFSSGSLGSYCQISKLLSDYMMYLLLVRPPMLPKGISEVRIRETQEEVLSVFNKKTSLTRNEIASALLQLGQPNSPFLGSELIMKPGRTKSVMFEGCKLACQFQALMEESLWDHEEKWKMIADVWMEMLAFAASECEWKEHAAQLRHGQELLTHVALLMAHLGLTKQIQIVKREQEQDRSLPWNWDQLSHLAYYLT